MAAQTGPEVTYLTGLTFGCGEWSVLGADEGLGYGLDLVWGLLTSLTDPR